MSKRYASSHATPEGPGDSRPTAIQVVADSGAVGMWSDRVILITGCSSGIGVETAKALFETGATLWLAARDLDKAREALGKDVSSSSRTRFMQLDLASMQSVRKAAQDFLRESDRLDVVIANAGIMASPFSRTEDGFETQIGTNHLGHFLLFELLRERLLASTEPRLVALSSLSHRHGKPDLSDLNWNARGEARYNTWESYGASKTATIWFVNEAHRRYHARGLVALSVHPGIIATPLQRHVSQTQKDLWAQDESIAALMKSPEQGAATTVWAATSPFFKNRGGIYLEDCSVSEPASEQPGGQGPGYASWAYDEQSESQLWTISQRLVGTL